MPFHSLGKICLLFMAFSTLSGTEAIVRTMEAATGVHKPLNFRVLGFRVQSFRGFRMLGFGVLHGMTRPLCILTLEDVTHAGYVQGTCASLPPKFSILYHLSCDVNSPTIYAPSTLHGYQNHHCYKNSHASLHLTGS